ncbi:cilia- and flagella-associated protein 45-like isoform X2 [Periplaneta americana]|uniref:cilia- and flagella-associated protein 45-like isoform X2 n=1 Tax=Periplaneta americana TaxID=6978 RepID=UPI0037E86ABA
MADVNQHDDEVILYIMGLENVPKAPRESPTKCSQNTRVKPAPKSKKTLLPTTNKRALDGKEIIRVVEYDDKIRELIVPSQKPTVYPALLDTDEFNRLKQQAKVTTMQERLNKMEEEDKRKNELMEQCMARKEQMRKWSKSQTQGKKYTLLESDAHRRATHLLRRAFEMKQEQEDEVKRANRLIIGTKCHAIRDAQIAEKKQIEKELEAEERRLDQMMEDERRRALRGEEELEEKERLKRDLYVQQVQEQIKENEIERILELEHKEEESRLINDVQMQVQLEELENYNRKLAQQQKIRDELNEINNQIKKFHELEIEEARINDLRIQEFMQKKMEREEAREREQAAQRLAKEREIARLRALQQRQQDLQAEMDELNALRVQEEVEREFRNKERAAVRKKKEEDEAMRKAREEQILDRRRMEALEISREKQAFERVLKAQKEAAEKQRLEDLRKQCILAQYRSDIMKQINEKERERILEKQNKFEEGVALKMEEVKRERYMKEVMRKKVNELRAHKVPEVYVKEIERQLKLT